MKKWWIFGFMGAVIGAALITQVHSANSKPRPAPQHHAPSISQSNKTVIREKSDTFSSMDVPQSLAIPSLGITSIIRSVGMTPSGAMDIPDSLTDAGWYEQSAHPGNPGKAVVAVHAGYPNKPSQFRQLEHIPLGAVVDVKDRVGATAHFRVVQTARYTPDTAPLGAIFGDSPTARLNIITCSGAWNPTSQTYAERLVVFTAREK